MRFERKRKEKKGLTTMDSTTGNTDAARQAERVRRRARWIGLAVVLGIAGLARTAAAEPLQSSPPASNNTTHDKDFSTNDTNPCTSESMTITGQEHTMEKNSNTPTRAVFDFSEHENGKGVADVSRVQYQYQNWTDNHFETTAKNMTSKFTMRKHMIRQGETTTRDDYTLFSTMTVTCVNFVCGSPVQSGPRPDYQCK
jgi:hypothetical protein